MSVAGCVCTWVVAVEWLVTGKQLSNCPPPVPSSKVSPRASGCSPSGCPVQGVPGAHVTAAEICRNARCGSDVECYVRGEGGNIAFPQSLRASVLDP